MLQTYQGGCHCQAVRFEVQADFDAPIHSCNCSICHMLGYLHLIVPKSQFTLHQGAEQLTSYQFNTQVAEHLFCRVCGVKSYYIPRSNPNGVSVNLRCLDGIDLSLLKIEDFDGQNWELHHEKLKGLTE